jgi:hypothetical protein
VKVAGPATPLPPDNDKLTDTMNSQRATQSKEDRSEKLWKKYPRTGPEAMSLIEETPVPSISFFRLPLFFGPAFGGRPILPDK